MIIDPSNNESHSHIKRIVPSNGLNDDALNAFPDFSINSTPGEIVKNVYVIITGVSPLKQELPAPDGSVISINHGRESVYTGVPMKVLSRAKHFLLLDSSGFDHPTPPVLPVNTQIVSVIEVSQEYYDAFWDGMQASRNKLMADAYVQAGLESLMTSSKATKQIGVSSVAKEESQKSDKDDTDNSSVDSVSY